jgi:hypothetical protein
MLGKASRTCSTRGCQSKRGAVNRSNLEHICIKFRHSRTYSKLFLQPFHARSAQTVRPTECVGDFLRLVEEGYKGVCSGSRADRKTTSFVLLYAQVSLGKPLMCGTIPTGKLGL